MLQVEDLPHSFNKDSIVNYERKLIESPFESLPKPASKHESKYSVCDLNTKIHELINDTPYNLRWIGNASTSPISAYMYCLLMLSVTNKENLLQFKNVFYELCRKYLTVKEQKLLIEFLYLLEFSSDKYLFLKKYPLIDAIIFNVFDKLQAEEIFYLEQERNSSQQITESSRYSNECRVSRSFVFDLEDSTTGQLFQMNKLAELYCRLGIKFRFLKWSKSSESSFVFTIDDTKKMYILVQKEYFFVLQILEKTEIKSGKSKLTKGDRIQVQRLLSYSHTSSQINFEQKINYLSDNTDKKSFQFKVDQLNTKNTIDSDSNKKDILVCNPKSKTTLDLSGGNFKKQFKFSYFNKKINTANQEIHESIIHPKESQKKSLDYIDLMESSFEEEKNQENDRNRIKKQVQESHSLKFYTPKFLNKPLLSPTQIKRKKESVNEKANKTQVVSKRGRSPSQVQKKYFSTANQGKEKKSSLKSKQLKFYSPPKHFSDSPEKKFTHKNEIETKNAHDTEGKEKQKENFKYFDKKYNQKKQEIHKNHIKKESKTNEKSNLSKIQTSFSYNPKIFNNRISLQSRKDLDLLQRFKLPTRQLGLNKIPQVDRSEEASRRELFEKKKIIREELSQSLNNKSQILLKKRLFEHLETKFAGENFNFLPKTEQKLNKSVEKEQNHANSEVHKTFIHQEKLTNFQKECPQNLQQSQLNGGFQIRIKHPSAEKPSKIQ